MSVAAQEECVILAADIRFPLERANGVQIVKTAHALARQGAHTTLLVRNSDPRPSDEILSLYGLEPTPRLHVVRLQVGHARGSNTRPRLRYLAHAGWAAVRARRRATFFTRDLQLAELLLLFRPLRPRIVYEAHAVEALMYRERGVLYGREEQPRAKKAARLKRREGHVWGRAHGFVTTTLGIRDTFLETHGFRDVARTRVIPNGCDVDVQGGFPELPRNAAPRVLYAGQLYPWKGVDVLVEAIAQVPEARLVILGGMDGEPDFERIRARVDAFGLATRTELLGTIPQAQVASQLERSDVVVVPVLRSVMTERHMSPIKALEAMAAGRPIVASDLASCRELLQDQKTAWLVPPGDAGALAHAVSGLINNPSLAERLARGAWERAPSFSWDARAGHLIDLFRGIAL